MYCNSKYRKKKFFLKQTTTTEIRNVKKKELKNVYDFYTDYWLIGLREFSFLVFNLNLLCILHYDIHIMYDTIICRVENNGSNMAAIVEFFRLSILNLSLCLVGWWCWCSCCWWCQDNYTFSNLSNVCWLRWLMSILVVCIFLEIKWECREWWRSAVLLLTCTHVDW